MPTEVVCCANCGGFVTTMPKGKLFNCEFCKQLNLITDTGTVAMSLPEPVTPVEDQPETPAPKTEEAKPTGNTLKSNGFGHFIAVVFLIAILVNLMMGNIWIFAATVAIFLALFIGLGSDEISAADYKDSDPDFGGVVWALTSITIPVLMPFLCWNVASSFWINLIGGVGFGLAILIVGTLVGMLLQAIRK